MKEIIFCLSESNKINPKSSVGFEAIELDLIKFTNYSIMIRF